MYLWLPFGCLVLFFSNHFFVGVYHQWFIYLETYTYERGNFFNWYPFFSLWFFGGFKKKISRECSSYLYLLLYALIIYRRSLTSCLSWWACWFLLALHVPTSFWLFQLAYFPIGILELVNIFFKIFFVSWLGLSYVESFNLVSSYGSTISLVQVLCFALCTLALVACSRWFWGSEDSIFAHSSIVHEHWGASPFSFRTLFLDLFDCFYPYVEMFKKGCHLICNI